jgi:hypothetical protein
MGNMKLSEYIEILEALKEKHGNVNVVEEAWNGYQDPTNPQFRDGVVILSWE